MATISPNSDFAASAPAAPAVKATQIRGTPGVRVRDPRLDFFRGLAMFIILIAHTPKNMWNSWIPARFGFSDATEIFVFCSGMASAIAFGACYAKKGWLIGTARVMYRVWQVYWAHIGLFFFVAMSLAFIDTYGSFDKSYVNGLNLKHFFDDPMPNLVGLFTLTYVPNYFDILPMYLVVLAMMPLFMALSRIGFWAVAGVSIAIWIAANLALLDLPAEPWSSRRWFFNPFGWQFLFFTGFAFMIGWIPAPPRSRTILWLAIGFVVLSAPFGSWKVFLWVNDFNEDLGQLIRKAWGPLKDLRTKSEFAVLRYVHFLALAYIGWMAVGEGGHRLAARGTGMGSQVWKFILTVTTKVGQQSLAVFVFSMAVARIIGFVLDQTGRTAGTMAISNLTGFAMLIGVAYTAGWFKSQPWKSKGSKRT
jgi:hypothetical protein